MLDVALQRIDTRSGMADKLAFTYLDNGQDVSARLSFEELDRRARSVAVQLQSVTQRGDRVLLSFPPSIDFVVAFFGCIYAGVVAVPTAPPSNARTMPRLLGIVEDAQAQVILSTAADIERLQRWFVATDGAAEEIVWLAIEDAPANSDPWRQPNLNADALVFMQYTSGSTGRPKGVMVSHRSLLANLTHIQTSYGLRPRDTLVSWLPQHHDFGLIGFTLLPVFTGAHTVLFPPAVFLMRPLRWLSLISRYCARVTGAPNFAFDLCVKRVSSADKTGLDLTCLELAINGADRVRPHSMRRFTDAFRNCGFKAESLTPSYGLAESTLLVCAGRDRGLDDLPKSLQISKEALRHGSATSPMADDDITELFSCGPVSSDWHHIIIADSVNGQSLAERQIGEIWVSGASLGSGYWNQPEASEKAFGATSPGDDQRYLRTGDLGFIADGCLYVSGRLKEMMIFQGRNVFPHDIEITVEALDAAFRPNGCAAFSVEDEHGAELVLVQEVESRTTPNFPGLIGRVRSELAERHDVFDLAALLLIKAGQLPRTSSGKIQRVKCRDLYLSGQIEAIWSWRRDDEPTAVSAARGTTREWVARIWQSLLGVMEIAPDADFFSMGGHSLLASQMVACIRDEFCIDLPLRAFFENPSIEGLATAIEQQLCSDEARDVPPPLRSLDRDQPLRLSWSQQRLWFLDQLDRAASVAYHLPAALRIEGPLDVLALRRALDQIVARHEILRTVFTNQDGVPVQRLDAAQTGFALQIVDLGGLDRDWAQTEVVRRAQEENLAPFDLSQGPLVRGQLLQLAKDEHVLLITQHHIVSDGWSIKVLIRELGVLYDACMRGEADPLPPLPIQYADYATWQRDWLHGEALRTQLKFWTTHLAGAPAMLDLPADRPRPAVQNYRGDRIEISMTPELTAALRRLAQAHGVTLFMVLLAGWSALLGRLSGQQDIVIGTPVANRQRTEIEPLVGFFVNTLALRVQLDDAQTVADLLAQIKATALGAYAHQDVPFEQVVDAVNPRRSLGQNPLFQAMLAFNNTPQDGDFHLSGLRMSTLEIQNHTTHFDLSLSLEEEADRVKGALVYATALFDAATIERHRDYLLRLLQAMVADANQPVARIDLLPPA
ncbi:condensation domain-containing protein, partial [Dyella humi]